MRSDITVVIPISPIPSHPETHILEETVESVRHHLPHCEIMLTFDGPRSDLPDGRLDAYDDHIARVLWKADHVWKRVCPFVFDGHRHQVGMMREIFDDIRTPYLLYVEQDTPLTTDRLIDWGGVTMALDHDEVDVVRFHHEDVIPDAHQHMILGPIKYHLLATCQWSQRPHLATRAFYRRILEACFSPGAKCFIEDRMHAVCHNAYLQDGIHGWYQYRIGIYDPDHLGQGMKRSYHLDGRAGEAKHDETQVF